MKRLSLFIAVALVAACAPPQDAPEPEIPKVTGSEWCESAEKNLLALGCPEGQPTKKGKRFAEFCRETQANGVDLNAQCLSGVKSCDEVDKVCAWHQ